MRGLALPGGSLMQLTPMEWQHLAEAAAYGLVGGLVGAMAKARRVRLPRIFVVRESDGSRSLELDWGFLVSPLVGAVLALCLDGRPETAVAYGLAGGWAGPAVVNALVEALLGKLGITLEPHQGHDRVTDLRTVEERARAEGVTAGLAVVQDVVKAAADVGPVDAPAHAPAHAPPPPPPPPPRDGTA